MFTAHLIFFNLLKYVIAVLWLFLPSRPWNYYEETIKNRGCPNLIWFVLLFLSNFIFSYFRLVPFIFLTNIRSITHTLHILIKSIRCLWCYRVLHFYCLHLCHFLNYSFQLFAITLSFRHWFTNKAIFCCKCEIFYLISYFVFFVVKLDFLAVIAIYPSTLSFSLISQQI